MSKKTTNRTKKLISAYQAADGREKKGIEKQLKARLKQLAKRRLRSSSTPGQPGVIKAVGSKVVGGTTTVHRTHKKRFRGRTK